MDLKSVAAHIRREEGFVNLVFANTGIVGPLHYATPPSAASVTSIQAALMEPDTTDFDSTTMVNNTAVFYTVIAFLDLLEAGNQQKNLMQDSQVLVTSSVAGFSRHMALSFAYATSKAAVNHLVKMLSTFFAQHGLRIRANLIAPGMYPSEMTMPVLEGLPVTNDLTDPRNTFNKTYMLSKDSSPAERSGSEADFAGAFLFLASRAGAIAPSARMRTESAILATKKRLIAIGRFLEGSQGSSLRKKAFGTEASDDSSAYMCSAARQLTSLPKIEDTRRRAQQIPAGKAMLVKPLSRAIVDLINDVLTSKNESSIDTAGAACSRNGRRKAVELRL
nr:rhamnolipids biosynthesis 3-oxoacyl-[acyl-carrier-protein] reductase [Quercus suber]